MFADGLIEVGWKRGPFGVGGLVGWWVVGVHSGVCIISKEMFIDCINERNN